MPSACLCVYVCTHYMFFCVCSLRVTGAETARRERCAVHKIRVEPRRRQGEACVLVVIDRRGDVSSSRRVGEKVKGVNGWQLARRRRQIWWLAVKAGLDGDKINMVALLFLSFPYWEINLNLYSSMETPESQPGRPIHGREQGLDGTAFLRFFPAHLPSLFIPYMPLSGCGFGR